MYLYLDLIWLLNLLINYLLLWMTGVFRKLEYRRWRLAVAAGIGSSYVLFLFLPALEALYTFSLKLILSCVLVLVAFGYGHWQAFIKSFAMFYFITFVSGGGLLAIHFMLQSQHELMNGMLVTQSTGLGDPLSWLFVVIGFPLMVWFTTSRWRQIERNRLKGQWLTKVTIKLDGQAITCVGLVDTGNQLYDPLSRTPVMLVETKVLREALPEALYKELNQFGAKGGQLGFPDINLDDQWLRRIRIIPYRGVKQSMEMMLALKPDRVEIVHGSEDFVSDKVLIGCNPYPLSQEGQFQAIIHPDLVQHTTKEAKHAHAY